MRDFIAALLICSVTMSALALLYIAVTPVLARRYSEKGRYYAWLVIVIGLLIPFRPQWDKAIVTVNIPSAKVSQTDSSVTVTDANDYSEPSFNETFNQTFNQTYIAPDNMDTYESAADYTFKQETNAVSVPDSARAEEITEDSVRNPVRIDWWNTAAALWLAGMAVFLSMHIIKHCRFMRMVKRWSEDVTDPETLFMFYDLTESMGLKSVNLRLCPCVSSPMLVGLVKPRVLLPSLSLSGEELRHVLTHELVHYKRRDLVYKCLTLAATAVHWFNPVAYLAARSIDGLCETSCDTEAVRGLDGDSRLRYSETIIGVVRYRSKLKTALSTNFNGGKKGLKKRITSIMDMRNKKTGVALFLAAVMVTASTGAAFAANTETPEAKPTAAPEASSASPAAASPSDQTGKVFTKSDFQPILDLEIRDYDEQSVEGFNKGVKNVLSVYDSRVRFYVDDDFFESLDYSVTELWAEEKGETPSLAYTMGFSPDRPDREFNYEYNVGEVDYTLSWIIPDKSLINVDDRDDILDESKEEIEDMFEDMTIEQIRENMSNVNWDGNDPLQQRLDRVAEYVSTDDMQVTITLDGLSLGAPAGAISSYSTYGTDFINGIENFTAGIGADIETIVEDVSAIADEFAYSYIQAGFYEAPYIFTLGWNLPEDNFDDEYLTKALVNIGDNETMTVAFSDNKETDQDKDALEALGKLIGRLINERQYSAQPLERPLVVDSVRIDGSKISELAGTYYEDGDLTYFTAIFPELSEDEQEAYVRRMFDDGNVAFFASCRKDMRDALVKLCAEWAYNEDRVNFFSIILDELADSDIKNWYNRALEDGNRRFTGFLSGYAEEVSETITETIERSFEEAYDATRDDFSYNDGTWYGFEPERIERPEDSNTEGNRRYISSYGDTLAESASVWESSYDAAYNIASGIASDIATDVIQGVGDATASAIEGVVDGITMRDRSYATTYSGKTPSEVREYLAEVYAIYEPFGLTYNKDEDRLYWNGKLVRDFLDILESNGESLDSGKFSGSIRNMSNDDGEVDINVVRDPSVKGEDGYGKILSIDVTNF